MEGHCTHHPVVRVAMNDTTRVPVTVQVVAVMYVDCFLKEKNKGGRKYTHNLFSECCISYFSRSVGLDVNFSYKYIVEKLIPADVTS